MSDKSEKIIFSEPEGLPQVSAVQAWNIANRFPRHVHTGYIFTCIDRGRRKMKFAAETVMFNAGEMCILPPGTSHNCESISGDTFGPHSYRALCVSAGYMKQLAEEITGRPGILPGFSPADTHKNFDRESFDIFFSLLECGGEIMERDIALREFLYHAILNLSTGNFVPEEAGNQQQALERVRNHIQTNFRERTTLSDLARTGCISPFYLQKLFVKHYGVSPQELLINCRIREAEKLLQQGIPPAEAAVDSGFADQSHFSRHFKKINGISPGRFINDNCVRDKNQ
ncbi:AraC family transcriptional regulator [Maridesulfovibrio sp.]|uniref:AraC family transcriptional regulator n=1 Tax=Maridesulfovibrio sp. TaxID=2795000 RepID=UPI002A18AECF|nr:AraC family transcriptional regulator [Maridesulfovibrio sp.]